jgi:dihydrodipicolinate synthase/N-acetylneuraminate lyase
MSANLVGRIADLPNVIGLKWYSTDLANWTEAYERFSERLAIIDNNAVWTSGLGFMMGAKGFVSQVANFAPEYELNILNLLRQKQWEKALEEM